ncbi:solute carrier family 2, facilitated glucose transporter member 6 isoform X3 [Bubalus bubalis]|uniref:solute carrier family 2, facilitated glucose transporter member 6 isoform X3 n=1 Tax=Bubalus bubalis TaxID=89462 RepID=UPI001E1B785A|nr:solute carrier family 2, facilitated glucose transporter member 6 isoform X3 [Bubalus bubalis]
MQEPLLGAEGRDYDTFPEKPPPSPGERTRVGVLQNKRVFLATFAAVLGNFSFGYALVYTSPVIPALEHSSDPNLNLTKTQASWFGSVFTLGAAAGGLSAMVLNDLLGRKLSIMFSAVPSAAGYALMAGAHGLWMLLLGRMLTGFAGGLTAACIPGRDAEALQALAWLRGPDADTHWEFEQIQDTVRRQREEGSLLPSPRQPRPGWLQPEGPAQPPAAAASCLQSSHLSWAEARDPHMYRPIAIALLMRFLQQLTGITPILVYLQSIFDSTAVLLPPKVDAAIVGAVRLLSVLIAALTMDLAGRKALLFVSAAGMFAANLTLGLYVHFGPKSLAPNSTVGLEREALVGTEQPLATPTSYLTLVPLLATMLFIMGYAMGWGPITWLLMSEILPLRARGVASGLCVLVSWLTAFALTKSFLLVTNAFGLQAPFFFFAAVCLVNLAFTGCCVPETKGRSLEQIESFFRTGRRSFLH